MGVEGLAARGEVPQRDVAGVPAPGRRVVKAKVAAPVAVGAAAAVAGAGAGGISFE
jgi:hypothetical protein